MPQILAVLRIRLVLRVRLPQHAIGEGVGNAMGVDGDKACRPLVLRVAETVGDASVGRPEAPAAQLETDQLSVLCIVGRSTRHAPLFQLLAVHRIDYAVTAGKGSEDAKLGRRGTREALDGPRLIGIAGISAERRDACKHPIADARGRSLILLALGNENARLRPVLL